MPWSFSIRRFGQNTSKDDKKSPGSGSDTAFTVGRHDDLAKVECV